MPLHFSVLRQDGVRSLLADEDLFVFEFVPAVSFSFFQKGDGRHVSSFSRVS